MINDMNYVNCKAEFRWMDAKNPPRKSTIRKYGDWDQSDFIWIRVAEVLYERDEFGHKKGEVKHPSYSVIGRCVWPKIAAAFHPVNNLPDSPVKVQWEEGECFYRDEQGHCLNATHWYPINEPLPHGTDLNKLQTYNGSVVAVNHVEVHYA